jgi:CYTH domain-containing protein
LGTEIEKKYIVNELPNELNLITSTYISQTYLAIGEEEIRVRKLEDENGNVNKSFTMTIKKGTGLEREEHEFFINERTYDQLLDGKSIKPLVKTRGTIDYEGLIYEVDLYKDFDFIIAEIEFNTLEDVNNYIPPYWLSLDVTEDKSYKNQNLWKNIQSQI